MKESDNYVASSVHKKSQVLTLKNNVKVAILFAKLEGRKPVECKSTLVYEVVLVLFTVLYTVVSILYLLPSKLVLLPVAGVVYFHFKIKKMKKSRVVVNLKNGGVYKK
jgi:hypothetical protein